MVLCFPVCEPRCFSLVSGTTKFSYWRPCTVGIEGCTCISTSIQIKDVLLKGAPSQPCLLPAFDSCHSVIRECVNFSFWKKLKLEGALQLSVGVGWSGGRTTRSLSFQICNCDSYCLSCKTQVPWLEGCRSAARRKVNKNPMWNNCQQCQQLFQDFLIAQ